MSTWYMRSCFSPREMKVITTRIHSWILGNGLKILSHDATSNGADMQNVRGSSVGGHKTKCYRGFEELYSVLGGEITCVGETKVHGLLSLTCEGQVEGEVRLCSLYCTHNSCRINNDSSQLLMSQT